MEWRNENCLSCRCNTGSNTITVLETLQKELSQQASDAEITLLDLRKLNLVFSDGRDFREYNGDTRLVADTIMNADALIFGTPVYQASISGALKNVLDLLPAGP
ncbi:MAG TPA: NAD(P)H-dependent oxidoreductase [Candidatus Limosilactobacillus faecipullorum]|nr:NAD(P)H-dependent oxidoreductase [Candidatus Limosilactobacillus faecipullorum]